MKGSFEEGVKLVTEIEKGLDEFSLYIDRHRVLVIHYKTALLYFGNGDYEASIDHLQKIINGPVDIRIDLQCYARLLHLMAHFELGNMELVEPLSRSVYRFMSKMKKFTVVEEEIFRFLRQRINKTGRTALQSELKDFLQRVKQFEKNRFETRAFAYLDVISWVESKVYRRSMGEVIHEKFLSSKKRNYTPVHHDV